MDADTTHATDTRRLNINSCTLGKLTCIADPEHLQIQICYTLIRGGGAWGRGCSPVGSWLISVIYPTPYSCKGLAMLDQAHSSVVHLRIALKNLGKAWVVDRTGLVVHNITSFSYTFSNRDLSLSSSWYAPSLFQCFLPLCYNTF